MADTEFKIELILADGTVAKTFAKVTDEGVKATQTIAKASDQATKKVADNADASAKAVARNAQTAAREFKNSVEMSLREIGTGTIVDRFRIAGDVVKTAITSPIVAASAAVAGLGLAIKTNFDRAFEGERIRGIERQFRLLSESFGIAGDKLREGLNAATAGLVDDTDVLEAANKGIVALGTNAARLPEIFELSRKAAAITGQDVVSVFETLNTAIASQQSRQLRGIGINFDANQALAEYARTLGKTKGALTEAEQQQAFLNKVLAEGKVRFGAVDPEINTLSNALARLRASFNDLGDAAAKNTQPGIFTGLINAVNSVVRNSADRIQDLNTVEGAGRAKIAKIEEQIRELRSSASGDISEGLKFLESQKKLQEDILKLAKEDEKVAERRRSIRAVDSGPNFAALAAENAQKMKQLQLDASIAAQKVAIASQELALTEEFQARLDAIRTVGAAREVELERQTALQLAQIRQQYYEGQITSRIEFDKQMQFIKDQADEKLKQNQRRTNKEIEDEMIRSGRIFRITAQSMADGVANSIQNMISAFAKGGRGGIAFAATLLDMFGGLAISLGKTLIAIGIGIDSIKIALATFSGAGAIIAGIALVALGSVLKAVATRGFQLAEPQGGVPQEAVTVGAEIGQGFVRETQRERTTQSTVSVTIEGDVLGDESAGKRIVDLVNKAFDAQGITIRDGAVA